MLKFIFKTLTTPLVWTSLDAIVQFIPTPNLQTDPILATLYTMLTWYLYLVSAGAWARIFGVSNWPSNICFILCLIPYLRLLVWPMLIIYVVAKATLTRGDAAT